ncbi:MAG: cupin domain-containing protein [Gemmatimonadetes bacterium]|nr:cupin domain-containing protein [Gemmatimonadota bacterium]NNM06505.1 cupin domain-containing protein [Gemmatimonadota bacterium]
MSIRPSASIPIETVPAGKAASRQVLIGPDLGPNFALRKFSMEPGGGMPLHTNTVEHEQYVLGGRARVVIGEEVHEVQKDDVVFIPGGVPHSYEALGEEPFEFLCIVPNLPDETKIVDLVVPEEELGC